MLNILESEPQQKGQFASAFLLFVSYISVTFHLTPPVYSARSSPFLVIPGAGPYRLPSDVGSRAPARD